jgi:hypothetical protein
MQPYHVTTHRPPLDSIYSHPCVASTRALHIVNTTSFSGSTVTGYVKASEMMQHRLIKDTVVRMMRVCVAIGFFVETDVQTVRPL